MNNFSAKENGRDTTGSQGFDRKVLLRAMSRNEYVVAVSYESGAVQLRNGLLFAFAEDGRELVVRNPVNGARMSLALVPGMERVIVDIQDPAMSADAVSDAKLMLESLLNSAELAQLGGLAALTGSAS